MEDCGDSHGTSPQCHLDGSSSPGAEKGEVSKESDKSKDDGGLNESGNLNGQTFRKRRLTLVKGSMADEAQAAAAAAAASLLSSDEEENDNDSGNGDDDEEDKDNNKAEDNDATLKGNDLSSKRTLLDDRDPQFGPTRKRIRSFSSASNESEGNHLPSVEVQSKKARHLKRPSRSVAKSMTHMHMNEGFICRIKKRLIAKIGNDASTKSGSHDARQKSQQRRGSNDTTDTEVFRHDHLPFPRDVVGTFSAHGIEPLYDEESDGECDGEKEDASSDGVQGSAVVAKINQDRGGVAYPYANDWHTALFAAYDGHGEGGELVSHFCMTEIQKRLEKNPFFNSDISRAFKETFSAVDEALEDEENIEPLYGGTTACVVLMQGRKLTIANCGDSRAVLGRRCRKTEQQAEQGETKEEKNNDDCDDNKKSTCDNVQAIDLSIDQNPDSPGEQERIESCGGYVSPPPDEGLSARVWLDPELTHIGLAMARSLGDHAVKSVGVISEPVVSFHELTDDDEFVIIATDGVWEFITSEEAVNITAKHFQHGKTCEKEGDYSGATSACRDLIETAAKRWAEHEGDYRDDITAVVVKTRELWDAKT